MGEVVNLREYIKQKMFYIERYKEAKDLFATYREKHLLGDKRASHNAMFYLCAIDKIAKKLTKMGVIV